MFTDHIIIKCECLLTAFSLNPNTENYHRIICMVETLGISSNSGTRIKFNPLVIDYSLPKATQIQKQLLSDECIEAILSGRVFESVTSHETVSKMGQDLITILSAPRNKILMWGMPWTELNSNCLCLLSKEKKLGLLRLSSINAKEELKFINIDYNEFKHLPVAESPGIEKGYEQYMDSDEDSDDVIQKEIAPRKQPKPPRKPRRKNNKINLNIDNLPYFNDENLKQLAPTLFYIGSNVEVPYDCDSLVIDELLNDEIKLFDADRIVNTDFSTLDKFLNSETDSILLQNKNNDEYDDGADNDANVLNSDILLYNNNDPLNDHYSYSLRRTFTPPQLSEDFTDISCDSKSEISLQAIEPSLKVTGEICNDLLSKSDKPNSMIEIRLATAFINDQGIENFPSVNNNAIPCETNEINFFTAINDQNIDNCQLSNDSANLLAGKTIVEICNDNQDNQNDQSMCHVMDIAANEEIIKTQSNDESIADTRNDECSFFSQSNLISSNEPLEAINSTEDCLQSSHSHDTQLNFKICSGLEDPTEKSLIDECDDVEIQEILSAGHENSEQIFGDTILNQKLPSPVLFAFEEEDEIDLNMCTKELDISSNRGDLNTPEIINQSDMEIKNIMETISASVSPTDQCSACPSMEVSEDEDEKFDTSDEQINNINTCIENNDNSLEENISCCMDVDDDTELKESTDYIKTDIIEYIHNNDNSYLTISDDMVDPLAIACPMDVIAQTLDNNESKPTSPISGLIEVKDYWQFNLEENISRDDQRIQPLIPLERCPVSKISQCFVKLTRLSNNVIQAHTSPKLILVRKFKEWRIGKPKRQPLNDNKKLYISLNRLEWPLEDNSSYESDSSSYSSSYSSQYYRPIVRRKFVDYSDSMENNDARDNGMHDRLSLTPITSNGHGEISPVLSKPPNRFLYVSLKREPYLSTNSSEISSSRSSLSSNSSNVDETEINYSYPKEDKSISINKSKKEKCPFNWFAKNFRTYSRTVMSNNENFQEEGSRENKYISKYYSKRCAAPSSEIHSVESAFIIKNKKLNHLNISRKPLQEFDINLPIKKNYYQPDRDKIVTYLTDKMKKKFNLNKYKYKSILEKIPGMRDFDWLKIDSKLRKQVVQVVEITKKGDIITSTTNQQQSHQLNSLSSPNTIQFSQNSQVNTITFASPITTPSTSTQAAQSNILQFLCRTNGRKIQLNPISKIGDVQASPALTTTTMAPLISRGIIKNKPIVINQIVSSSLSNTSNSMISQTSVQNLPKLNQLVWSNVCVPNDVSQKEKSLKPDLSGMKITLPLSKSTSNMSGNIIGTPILHLAPNIRQKFVHLSGIKIAPSQTVTFVTENKTTNKVDNSTLEQLKEFDMVYEQVKVNSISNNATETITCSSSSVLTSNPQPVVVVTNINTPSSCDETINRVNQSNRSKSLVASDNNVKKSVSSPTSKSPQKSHEDEETVQRIHNILAGYAEQIRNSPDLKNKLAPRKRSNLLSTVDTTSSDSNSKSPNLKRKKTTLTKPESPITEFYNDDQSLPATTSTYNKIEKMNIKTNNIIIPTTSATQTVSRQIIIRDSTTSFASKNNFTQVTNNTVSQNKSVNYIVPINIVKIVSTNGTKMISNTNTQNSLTTSTNGNFNNSFVIQRFGNATNVSPILLRSQPTAKTNPNVIVVTCNKPNKLIQSNNVTLNDSMTITKPTTPVILKDIPQPNNDYLILEEDEKSQFNDQFLSVHSKEDDKSIETTVHGAYNNPMTVTERKKLIEHEYEDLGVDEPSTNDLFPEADIFFDVNTLSSNNIDTSCDTNNKYEQSLDSPDSNKLVVNKSAHYRNYSKPTEHRDKRKKSPSFHRRLKFAKKTLKLDLRKYNKSNDEDDLPNGHIPIDLLSTSEQNPRVSLNSDKRALFQKQTNSSICLDNSITSNQPSYFKRIDLIGSK